MTLKVLKYKAFFCGLSLSTCHSVLYLLLNVVLSKAKLNFK